MLPAPLCRAARPLALALVGLALGAAATPLAAQTTITFAANACSGFSGNQGTFNTYNSPFDVQGFRFASSTSTGFDTPCAGNGSYAGTTTLSNLAVGGITTLTQLSGAPFAISSIALAQNGQGAYPAETVTFTGTLVGGTTVMQSFTIPAQSSGSPTLATYTFLPTFAGLVSLQFSPQTSPYYQFTNLQLNQPAGVTAAPEPGTWALLGTGLLALSGVARRRRTRMA